MRGTCSWSALLLQISETSFLHWLPPRPSTAKLPPCSTAPCMAHTMHKSLITTSPHRCSVTVHSMLSIFLVTANVRLVRLTPVLCHSSYHTQTSALSQAIPMPLTERISCSYQCNVKAHTMRSLGLYHSHYHAHTTLECL